jgi:hypothetical protein
VALSIEAIKEFSKGAWKGNQIRRIFEISILLDAVGEKIDSISLMTEPQAFVGN